MNYLTEDSFIEKRRNINNIINNIYEPYYCCRWWELEKLTKDIIKNIKLLIKELYKPNKLLGNNIPKKYKFRYVLFCEELNIYVTKICEKFTYCMSDSVRTELYNNILNEIREIYTIYFNIPLGRFTKTIK